MTFTDMAVLPLKADGLEIETFVDDTYQNLLSDRDRGVPYGYPGQQLVSDDGQQVLFTVASNKSLAEEAGRVFVRGALQARVARGAIKTESAKLPLVAG